MLGLSSGDFVVLLVDVVLFCCATLTITRSYTYSDFLTKNNPSSPLTVDCKNMYNV